MNGIQIFCIFLLALLATSMASSEWSDQLNRWDERQIRHYFGEKVAEEIETEVMKVFEENPSETASRAHPLESFNLSSLSTLNHELPPELATALTWALERGVLLSDMAHRTLRRLLVLMEFDTLGCLTFCVFLIDGITDWRIRRVSFAYSSPLAHRTTLWLFCGLIGLLAVAVIAPLPFFPALIPLHILVLSWILRTHVAHLPKRL